MSMHPKNKRYTNTPKPEEESLPKLYQNTPNQEEEPKPKLYGNTLGQKEHKLYKNTPDQEGEKSKPKLYKNTSGQKLYTNTPDQKGYEVYQNTLGQATHKMYTNTPYLIEQIPNSEASQDNLEDEFLLIESFEKFQTKTLFFPSYDLLNFLVNNNSFPKTEIAKSIRKIDSDGDGFLSLVDILTYLLHSLRHRSIKIALQFLYLKIYKGFNLSEAEYFFTKNNIDPSNEIDSTELCDLLLTVSIESPITRAIIEQMKLIFPTPNTYKQLIEWINEYRETNKKKEDEIDPSKKQDKKPYNPYKIEMDIFERQIRALVQTLIDSNDNYSNDNDDMSVMSINNEELKLQKFRENLKTIINNNNNQLNQTQYNLSFAKTLNIEPYVASTMFQLLKTISPTGEQLISQSDLFNFLESYISISPNVDIFDDNNYDTKLKTAKSVFNMLQSSGPPLKFVLEKLPFCTKGVISICEVMKMFNMFYGKILHPNYFTIIFNVLDQTHCGFISYTELQELLRKYGTKEKFSSLIEFQFMASELLKEEQLLTVNCYFNQDALKDKIQNVNCISKNEHDLIIDNLVTSNNVKFNLFEYLCKKSHNVQGYSLNILISLIEQFYVPEKIKSNISINEINRMNEEKLGGNISLTIKEIENAIMKISLGEKGSIAVFEFIKYIPENKRSEAAFFIDRNQCGFVEYPFFVSYLREAYGNSINLNVKLCAQYMYKQFIQNPNQINEFIISKLQIPHKNIDIYVSRDTFYSNFVFGFANDKTLFETFYMTYKEKKGGKKGLLNLRAFYNFIKNNNIECREEEEEDYVFDDGKAPQKVEKAKPKDSNGEFSIDDILSNNSISIKEIFNFIDYTKGDLKTNFTISEKYISTLLNSSFDIDEDSLNTILDTFRYEKTRFNIKKFFDYDKTSKKKVLNSEILPKIKQQISNSEYRSYRLYLNKTFDKQYLDIIELCKSFCFLYKLKLYDCLLIIQNETYLNVDKFFVDNSLRELFSASDHSPTLKLAIRKLNEYFDSHKDKLKIFKQCDKDKNGYLSKEEFITFLNSFKDLGLNDGQKIELLTIADKDKNGKIVPREFLSFIKTIKAHEERSSTSASDRNSKDSGLPLISKEAVGKNISTKRNNTIVKDIRTLKENVKFNKQILSTKQDDFLNLIVLLQEDLVKNYDKLESIEQDFYEIDTKNVGFVDIAKFSIVLKKKLFILNYSNFEKFVVFANEGLPNSIKQKLNNEQKISYTNFLDKLVKYQHPKEKDIPIESVSNVSNQQTIKSKKSTS